MSRSHGAEHVLRLCRNDRNHHHPAAAQAASAPAGHRQETDRCVHSPILEAVQKHATCEEQMRNPVKEALAADAKMSRTGEAFRAEDVHEWARRIAPGVASPRPKAWRK
jgi:hypothetical protein